MLLTLAGCGKKDKKDDPPPPPPNVGGGYTLVVSGGTLNGSGAKGLSILVTLRDAAGIGPGGAAGWRITITGPGINVPLVVDYDDGSTSSYSAWWWENFDPLSGTYTATATNGITTLTYTFPIYAASSLPQPVLNRSGNTISWNTVAGAGSYYYELTDGSGAHPVIPGYLESNPLVSQYSFTIPALSDGSYLVSVYALTNDRLALSLDDASWPSLPPQNNDSLKTIDFVQGGTESEYVLDASGGTLYEGSLYSDETGTVDFYGLVVWASIVTTSTPSTAPAGDWNLRLTGPGISPPPGSTDPALTFVYPRTDSHYIWWDFGWWDSREIPPSGTFTLTATPVAGGSPITHSFEIPSPTAKLQVAAGLTATPSNGGGASIHWNAVTDASSYYVNIWTCVGNGSVNTDMGCTNDGEYTEIAGTWVNQTSVTVANGTLTKNTVYDVYITASELDMTDMNSMPLPVNPGSQVNMSDTTFSYATFTAL